MSHANNDPWPIRKTNHAVHINPVPTERADASSHHEELHEVSRFLHLFQHRNKNQHRGQKWWKWVRILRCMIKKLLGFEDERWITREEAREKGALERRVKEILLPRAWLAFTTLVADSQFSTLGVTLISVLARVRRIIGQRNSTSRGLDMDEGVKRPLPPDVRHRRQVQGEAMLKEQVEDTGRVVERRIESEELRIADAPKGGSKAMQLKPADVAGQYRRSAGDRNEQEATVVDEKAEQLEVGKDKVQGRSKKRRKKSNAIDDLFGELL